MTSRHLVIAGQGRAGSTLFYNVLRSSLKGFHMPESEARAKTMLGHPGNVCTKRPCDIFDVPDILRAAAGRKNIDLIVTLRDPRDILTSRHSRVPNDYFCGADLCHFIPPVGKPELKAPGFLPAHKAILEVPNSDLFPQGIFFLKYEDLVQYPDEVQRLLAEGLDLEFEGSFRDFHQQQISWELQRAMNGVRALETARQEKWRTPEHWERIVDQFTRFPILHDVLVTLGYEKDRAWFEEFVAPPPPGRARQAAGEAAREIRRIIEKAICPFPRSDRSSTTRRFRLSTRTTRSRSRIYRGTGITAC